MDELGGGVSHLGSLPSDPTPTRKGWRDERMDGDGDGDDGDGGVSERRVDRRRNQGQLEIEE